MNLWFTLGWGIIFGAGLVLEILALIRKDRGDTLSEHVWFLLRKGGVVFWFLALGFFMWLIVHFFGFGIVDGWIRSW